MKFRKKVAADNAGIAQITGFVSDRLREAGVSDVQINKSVLVVEEAAGCMVQHAPEGVGIDVRLKSYFGYVTVELSSEGDKFSLEKSISAVSLAEEEMDEGTLDVIRRIMLRSFAPGIRYHHTNGTNRIRLMIVRSPRAHLYRTLGALAAAVITGMILSGIGADSFNSVFDSYLLNPIKTMYMNALKMVVAPVVFFSIVSCIMRFSDMSELGRIGGRVITVFMFTTVVAVFVGIGMFYLFRPGGAVVSGAAMDSVKDITSQNMDVSLKDMLTDVVPADFLQPFVSSNMLQLIFLAVVCGVATAHIGSYTDPVRNFFDAANELFLRITTMIIRFMPVAVFCSICSMMINVGFSAIVSILGMFFTFIAGLLCMILVYCIILAVAGRLNPVYFLKSYVPSMAQVFSIASSNASIPVNMEACKKMGVPQKIYCLSIPLGATLNMDGACVYLAVFSLALAKVYGVQMTAASIAAMVISIIVLSMGAPGIPGSGLICLSVVLTQIGTPAEAVGLVMGIDAFVGMFRCMSNCTGDVMTSVLVAKREKLLDIDRYSAKDS